MTLPDWRTLILPEGVHPEPIPGCDRLILWLRGQRVEDWQEWARISTTNRPKIEIEHDVCAAKAKLIHARQRLRGFLGKLLQRLRGGLKEPTALVLPNGDAAEPYGDNQTDLVLAWADQGKAPLDEAQIRARWPQNTGTHQLAKNLWAIHGVTSAEAASASAQALPQGSPTEIAEQLLASARTQGDLGKLVAALTDLGVVFTQQEKCQRGLELLEEALALARNDKDPARERDVLGNLGMALIAQDPRRALELLRLELASAGNANDPFTEKTALSHLGIFYLRTRDAGQAFACFDKCVP